MCFCFGVECYDPKAVDQEARSSQQKSLITKSSAKAGNPKLEQKLIEQTTLKPKWGKKDKLKNQAEMKWGTRDKNKQANNPKTSGGDKRHEKHMGEEKRQDLNQGCPSPLLILLNKVLCGRETSKTCGPQGLDLETPDLNKLKG